MNFRKIFTSWPLFVTAILALPAIAGAQEQTAPPSVQPPAAAIEKEPAAVPAAQSEVPAQSDTNALPTDQPPEQAAPPSVAPTPAPSDVNPAPAQAPAAPTPAAAAPEPSKQITELSSTSQTPAAASWAFKHFFDHIKVRGYTQIRFNQPTTNPELVNLQGDRSMGGEGGIFIRRARLVLSGDVHPQVYIYLQPDFASNTESGQNFVQMRDWYFDLSDPSTEFRIRVGQSKVPYGFENMQSSQNRLPLDRSDALNSALANERDLGAFIYYAPKKIRERFAYLVSSGLKGSGDYGVVGIGVYNGQTANRPELNKNKHVVGRVSYPFLIGEQFLEVGGGGYYGKYVIAKSEGIGGADEFTDARAHLAFTLYPQPFGLQVEYNVGIGPELEDVTSVDGPTGTVFSGTVESEFLHGGYALASFMMNFDTIGTLTPYARGILYEGGKKHEVNSPSYSIRELDMGLEWQPIPALEFVGAFVAARRTFSKLPYQMEEGYLGRFQVQVNY